MPYIYTKIKLLSFVYLYKFNNFTDIINTVIYSKLIIKPEVKNIMKNDLISINLDFKVCEYNFSNLLRYFIFKTKMLTLLLV